MDIFFKTKSQAVYENLRRDIVDGKLKPGQKIIVSDLSREFGLSEIPIREAVRKLESEGLIQLTPHVGTMVSKIDGKEVIEIYLIRTELESLAAKLATPYLTEEDLDFLRKRISEMESVTNQKNYEKLGTLNKDFHLRIYRAAPYPYLFKLIVELWEKVHRTRGVFALVPERAIASIKEHKRIVEAIRRKDPTSVGRLVRDQKDKSMKALTDYLAENKGSMENTSDPL